MPSSVRESLRMLTFWFMKETGMGRRFRRYSAVALWAFRLHCSFDPLFLNTDAP